MRQVNEKAEDDLHNALEDRFGGTPDEIADKANVQVCRLKNMLSIFYLKILMEVEDVLNLK